MSESVDMGRAAKSEAERTRKATRLLMSGLLVVGLLATAAFIAPASSQAAQIGIGMSVQIGPPPLPVYEQSPCPEAGYIWTPGYWAYDPADGYYWVPGTWVMAPEEGLLWTPGYWGWEGNAFLWHAGYWGPHVGFYGGIDYGFGYPGQGFYGGEWRGHDFYYNRAVTNFQGEHITHVYDRQVNNVSVSHVSYNGGSGGLTARPRGEELTAEHERHIAATSLQQRNATAARSDRSQFASVNHGRPEVAAAAKPGEFQGANVMRASRAGGPVKPEDLRAPSANATHPSAHNSSEGGGVHANAPQQSAPAPHGDAGKEERPTRQPLTPTAPARSESNHGSASPQHETPQQRQATQPLHRTPPSHSETPHGSASPHQEAPQQRPQVHNTRPLENRGSEAHAPAQHAAPERHAPAQERQAPAQHAPAEHQSEHRPPEHKEPGH
jgi:hypothetical protein